jgi:hypothetical protein
MGITLNLQFHQGNEYVSRFQNIHDPRILLIRELLKEMMQLPELKNPKNQLPADIAADYISPGAENQNIEVLLVDNNDAFDLWDAPEGSLGFHCISSGNDETPWSEVHRVVINMDDKIIREHLLDLRLDSYEDPFDDATDFEGLKGWLITITHEIAHALEFIENSNGLTPDMIGNMCDEFELGYNLLDFSTGAGISQPNLVPDQYDSSDNPEMVNISAMEDRVEAKGINYLNSCMQRNALLSKLISEAASFYAPTHREIESGLDSKKLDNNYVGWPIIVRNDAFLHVGNLDEKNNSGRFSLEGGGLSVSDHPLAWMKIARLNGGIYAMKKDNALLIDMIIAAQDEKLNELVVKYGMHKKLITPCKIYKVTDSDDSFTLFSNKKDAINERPEDADIEDYLEVYDGHKATVSLARKHGFPDRMPLGLVKDMLFLTYSKEVLKLDGAWWHEELSPMDLSAPRGSVFDIKNKWEIIKIDNFENIHSEISQWENKYEITDLSDSEAGLTL